MHRPKLVVASRKERDGNNIMSEQLVDDQPINRLRGQERCHDLSTYFVRKCSKWTTKVVFHLFEAMLNAHVLYTKSDNPPLKFDDFKLEYIKSVLVSLPKFAKEEPTTFP